MKIAFHAPMKPPGARTPSGDRTIARLLCRAIRLAAHDVTVATTFRSYLGNPAPDAFEAMNRRAEHVLARLRRMYGREPPDLWFTYHLYHKAPDMLGPPLCQAFGIPYVVAEASFAPKQANGPWAQGHRRVRTALAAASHVFFLNPDDAACVLPVLSEGAGTSALAPFTAVPPAVSRRRREKQRVQLSKRFGIDPAVPWCLAAGMMRPGDKMASYRYLAEAVANTAGRSYRVLIAGDGPARDEVAGLFSAVGDHVVMVGPQSPKGLGAFYQAADLFVWPAVGEAVGMATLEAMAAGLPVISGRTGAVPDSIVDGISGCLVDSPDEMARKIAELVDSARMRTGLGKKARQQVIDRHSLRQAASHLDSVFRSLEAKPR